MKIRICLELHDCHLLLHLTLNNYKKTDQCKVLSNVYVDTNINQGNGHFVSKTLDVKKYNVTQLNKKKNSLIDVKSIYKK